MIYKCECGKTECYTDGPDVPQDADGGGAKCNLCDTRVVLVE